MTVAPRRCGGRSGTAATAWSRPRSDRSYGAWPPDQRIAMHGARHQAEQVHSAPLGNPGRQGGQCALLRQVRPLALGGNRRGDTRRWEQDRHNGLAIARRHLVRQLAQRGLTARAFPCPPCRRAGRSRVRGPDAARPCTSSMPASSSSPVMVTPESARVVMEVYTAADLSARRGSRSTCRCRTSRSPASPRWWRSGGRAVGRNKASAALRRSSPAQETAQYGFAYRALRAKLSGGSPGDVASIAAHWDKFRDRN